MKLTQNQISSVIKFFELLKNSLHPGEEIIGGSYRITKDLQLIDNCEYVGADIRTANIPIIDLTFNDSFEWLPPISFWIYDDYYNVSYNLIANFPSAFCSEHDKVDLEKFVNYLKLKVL